MVRCHNFRIFVTVLAAFAAFFAFICRFNLSIVIEEMVVRRPTTTGPDSSSGAQVTPSPIATSTTSESPLATLARPPWWPATGSASVDNQTRHNRSQDPVMIDFYLTQRATNQSFSMAYEQQQRSEPELLDWSEEDKNRLLGAFFVTYSLAQVPAGRAAEILGPKTLLLAVGLGSGLGSLLFPRAVRWSANGFVPAYAIRLMIGACQAGMFPAIYVLLCRWLPKLERSSWLAVPSALGRIGTISMNLVVPLVLRHYDWQTVFTICGGVTLVWTSILMVFGSDSPATSRWLSSSELLHIESRMEPHAGAPRTGAASASRSSGGLCIGTSRGPPDHLEAATEPEVDSQARSSSLDWAKVLSNRPVLVLTLVMFSADWTNMLLLTKLPGFLTSAMRMEVGEVGLLSSALVAVYCFGYPLSGVLASRLEAAEIERLHSLNIRKLFEALAHLFQTIGCLIIAFTGGRPLVISALFLMMLGRSTVGGGQCQMPPELSREFPGTVMAIANSGASLSGVVGPATINLLVGDASDYNSWRNLWLFSAALYLFAGLVFVLLADNAPQDFSKPTSDTLSARLCLPPYIPPPPLEVLVGDEVELPPQSSAAGPTPNNQSAARVDLSFGQISRDPAAESRPSPLRRHHQKRRAAPQSVRLALERQQP